MSKLSFLLFAGWLLVLPNQASASVCDKYNGRYVAYWGDVFKVEDCKRWLLDPEKVFSLTKKKVVIKEIDNATAAALPPGKEKPIASAASCDSFNGRYVTYLFSDIYFVQNCKRRKFPDWETYLDHRGRIKASQNPLLSLTWEELNSMELGEPIESFLDKNLDDIVTGSAGIEVIPIEEACEGVNGRFVSHMSLIYKIENCFKRKLNSDIFTRKYGNSIKPRELTSEQWLSLPNGPPLSI